MISDLDDSLTTLLKQQLPPAIVSSTQISFDAPDNQFPPTGVTLPAINLFLYDVRENMDLRAVDWIIDKPESGNLVKYPPPVRVDCAYLVTAWPSDGSTTRARDEHLLLSEVMQVLLRFPIIPNDVLSGELVGQTPPLPAMSLGPGRLQSVAEFWQALGGKPKAALTLIVTIGVAVAQTADGGPPIQDRIFSVSQGATPPS
ncbi:MAG TPA: DUF4255 domain-containing protein [Solirubrobacteraceae bacterium]|nr:DUF4255 domain-containing protein [Solirubrobacteraceae bacterium]